MKTNWMVLTAAVVAALSICFSNATHVLKLRKAFPLNTSQDLEFVIHRDHSRHQHLVGEFPLSGGIEIAGIYYTKIALGSPPQEFNVQVDTGSDLLWISCSTCTNCPRATSLDIKLNFFNYSQSSTASLISCSDSCSDCIYETNTCGYKLSYLDGSETFGEVVRDSLQINPIGGASPNSSSPVVFGCSKSRTGLFATTGAPVDGIIGFGKGSQSVLTQLYSAGISPNVFSHCLSGGKAGGGFLVMGAVIDPSIVYSPLIPNQVNYNLQLLNIDVNGTELPVSSKSLETKTSEGIVVDSGTTLAYLAEDVYEAFISAINTRVSKQAKPHLEGGRFLCYQLAATSGIEVFPPVTLTFSGNANMVLRPEDYLFRIFFPNGSAEWCMGFQKSEPGSYSILGDVVLRDRIVIYDLVKQQVGLSSHLNCSSSINVDTTYGFKSEGTISTSPKFKLLLTIPIIIITSIISLAV